MQLSKDACGLPNNPTQHLEKIARVQIFLRIFLLDIFFFSVYKLKSLLETSARCCRKNYRSPVAQLVEQAAVNRLVAGSSPARGANY